VGCSRRGTTAYGSKWRRQRWSRKWSGPRAHRLRLAGGPSCSGRTRDGGLGRDLRHLVAAGQPDAGGGGPGERGEGAVSAKTKQRCIYTCIQTYKYTPWAPRRSQGLRQRGGSGSRAATRRCHGAHAHRCCPWTSVRTVSVLRITYYVSTNSALDPTGLRAMVAARHDCACRSLPTARGRRSLPCRPLLSSLPPALPARLPGRPTCACRCWPSAAA
jgi:hypothetical protein